MLGVGRDPPPLSSRLLVSASLQDFLCSLLFHQPFLDFLNAYGKNLVSHGITPFIGHVRRLPREHTYVVRPTNEGAGLVCLARVCPGWATHVHKVHIHRRCAIYWILAKGETSTASAKIRPTCSIVDCRFSPDCRLHLLMCPFSLFFSNHRQDRRHSAVLAPYPCTRLAKLTDKSANLDHWWCVGQ